MPAPLISTPMMRIGLKRSAIVSLVALSSATALLTGCKKAMQKADETVSANVKEAQDSISGKLIIGVTTAGLTPESSSLTVDAATAAKLVSRVGNAGMFTLVGAPTGTGKPVSATVTYSAVNATTGHITITPTGTAFAIGSFLQPADGGAYALKLLTESVKDTTASASEKAVANMAVGHSEVLAADAVFRKIDVAQNRLERLLGHVAAMTSQLQTNNVTIGGLAAKDPAKALAAIDKTTTAAKTGEQGVWYPSDAAPIPALAAIDASIADLNSKVATLKAHHDDLAKQRTDALQQSEKLAVQSESAKGKQSVDLFTQASNLRKTAADLSIQMTDTDAKLAGQEREVAVATAQQTQLQAALTKFADQNKQVNTNWDAVKQRIAGVVAQSKLIVEGDSTATTAPSTRPSFEPPVASLTAAGDQITAVLAELDKLRADAKAHLDKADKYYAEAAKLDVGVAAEVSGKLKDINLQQAPERLAWQWRVEIHNDTDATLQRAQIQQRLARLYADAVYYANTRLSIEGTLQTVLTPTEVPVKAALDDAKVALPKALDPGDVATDIAAAKKSADDAFGQAEAYLKTVIDQPTNNDNANANALINTAKVAKMVEQYGRYAFATATSQTGADAFKSKAHDLAVELSKPEKNAILPLPLPPEIAPVPPDSLTSGSPAGTTAPTSSPTTSPDTQPTDSTQPSTAPSTQETPATAPATPDTNPATPATAPADATPPATAPATPPATPETPAPPVTAPAAPATPATPDTAPTTPTPPPAAAPK